QIQRTERNTVRFLGFGDVQAERMECVLRNQTQARGRPRHTCKSNLLYTGSKKRQATQGTYQGNERRYNPCAVWFYKYARYRCKRTKRSRSRSSFGYAVATVRPRPA